MPEEVTPPFDFSSMRGVETHRWEDDDTFDLPPPQSEEEVRLDRQEKREVLIRQVSEGLMMPATADDIAVTNRLGRLSSRFRHSPDLNPELSFWNVEMTAAWIKEKSAVAVHRHYEPYYADMTVWTQYPPFAQRPRQASRDARTASLRYRLVTLEKARFEGLYHCFDGKHKALPPLSEFFPTLRGQLATGAISAIGTPLRPDIDRPRIAAGYWQTADFDVTDEHGACLRLQGTVIFRDIQFNAAKLLSLYPPPLSMRISPARVRRWNNEIVLNEAYKVSIVEKLRAVFPRGVPDWRPKKTRDRELRRALGPDLTRRWGCEAEGRPFNDEAFCIAMDRILGVALRPDVVVITGFKAKDG